jgi:hypothetical protein
VRALGRVAVLGEGNEDDDDDADLTADGKFVAFDAKSSAATEVASGASAYVVTLEARTGRSTASEHRLTALGDEPAVFLDRKSEAQPCNSSLKQR